MDIAWGDVTGLTLASGSSGEGEDEASFTRMDAAEFRGFDLGIDEFDSKTKLYYKESGKLRKDSHLKMDRVDLDIAWGDVTGLTLASGSSGEGEDEASFTRMDAAEFRGFDLGIDEFDSKTKLYYEESGKLRKDSHLKMDRVDLDIAWGDVTGLTLASGSSGEGEDEASFTRMDAAEFRGFDLGIDEFDSKTKLYYEEAEDWVAKSTSPKESGKLRKDSHLKMKRLDLDIAHASMDNLSFASSSSEDGMEASLLNVKGFELRDMEFRLEGVELTGNLYDESGTLRESASKKLGSLNLNLASLEVGKFEWAFLEQGNHRGSTVDLEDLKLTGLDLELENVEFKSSSYFENAQAQKETKISLDSLKLEVEQFSSSKFSLRSSSDSFSEQKSLDLLGVNLEGEGLELDMKGLEYSSKSYDPGGVMRKDSHVKIDSVALKLGDLSVEEISYGYLSEASDDYRSNLNVVGVELNELELNVSNLEVASKVYHENSNLKKEKYIGLENLDLKADAFRLGYLQHETSRQGVSKANSLNMFNVEVAALDMSAAGVSYGNQLYDESGQVREDTYAELASIELRADSLGFVSLSQQLYEGNGELGLALKSSSLGLEGLNISDLEVAVNEATFKSESREADGSTSKIGARCREFGSIS